MNHTHYSASILPVIMTEKDFAISTVSSIPIMGTLSRKPIYLVTLENLIQKKGSFQLFIAVDKPESQNGFILAKGFFSDLPEEEIIKTFSDILTKTSKDLMLDMWFPWHRICSVRSLVFNANKLQTLVK